MVSKVKNILEVYFGIPNLTKLLLPMVIIEHLLAAFCLNISAFFKKCSFLQYDVIGQFISLYYWGCLLGALIGGILTLHFRTNRISSLGLIFISISFYYLINSTNNIMIGTAMFFLGLIGTIIATSNIASLVRSVMENEANKLKVISLDLILFNLSFSFITFILLDLTSQQISKFISCFLFSLISVGVLSLFFYQDDLFNLPKIKKHKYKFFIPQRKKEFILLISMIFCFGLIFSMVKILFTPTLLDRFGSNMIAVSAASINPWFIFLIQPLLIHKIKNSNSIWMLGSGGLIVGISYFMFGMVNSFILTAIVLILLTVGEMMFGPLSKQLNIQFYGSGQEGLASGMWGAIFLGSGIIGARLSGYLAKNYGADLVWAGCGLLGIICFVLSLGLLRIKNKKILYNVTQESL